MIIISDEKIEITIDAEPLKRELATVQAEIEKTKEDAIELAEAVEEKTTKSFKEVMGFMRMSYLMISGASRVIGGGMSQVFSSIYMVGMSAIATYKAIAAAIAATGPAGWVQAGIMTVSLITASTSLASILLGQRELSTKIRGINMMLHGLSSMISGFTA